MEQQTETLNNTNNQLQEELKEKQALLANSTSTNTESTNISSQPTSQKSNTTTSTNSSQPSEAATDCNIKGSKNGIYHVPGSTYYSRTKNVVRWFCSPEEAENAGYKAPKR